MLTQRISTLNYMCFVFPLWLIGYNQLSLYLAEPLLVLVQLLEALVESGAWMLPLAGTLALVYHQIQQTDTSICSTVVLGLELKEQMI